MLVSLAILKKHLNIESDFTADDEYITGLEGVAEQVLSQDLCEDLEDMSTCDGVPKPLLQAIKLLVGQYYANREPVAFAASSEVPLTYRHLVSLYRNYEK